MADANKVDTEPIDCSPPRKRKETNESVSSVHAELKDLSHFQCEKILSNNAGRKTICMQGKFNGLPGSGIVLLEKTAFELEKLREQDFFSNSPLKQLFHNDIYGNYECMPKVELNSIKTTVIHPATDAHIEKHSVQTLYILNETPQIYKDIIIPHLKKDQFTLQWVYNILEHKSEVERIVFEDPDPVNGFVLLPDLKWDGKTLSTLYLLAITHARDIKSIRDLNETHLPLLCNIRNAGTKAIKEKYGLDASRLRIYLHYHPSFYHLHVHFTFLQYDAPGIYGERCHLLENVISNIELLSDYYQRVTIPVCIREKDKLFDKLEEKGILKKNDVGTATAN